jgi:hypothetical protein
MLQSCYNVPEAIYKWARMRYNGTMDVRVGGGKMRSHVAVGNTLNNQRLRDGGPPLRWVPYEPDWLVFAEPLAAIRSLAIGLGCGLPPVDHCWVYHVWRAGRGFEPAGQRGDRYHLMYELVAGEPVPAGLVPDHLCGGGRLGCINPFHLRLVAQRENAEDRRYIAPRRQWASAQPPSFAELIKLANEYKETA